MFDFVGDRVNPCLRPLLWAIFATMSLTIAACNKKESAHVQDAPKTFASPEDAGKALADATKSQNRDQVLAIFGPGSEVIVSSGDAAQDKAALDRFTQAYQRMNRWRKLRDGSEVLLVGADNQEFPIPLMKNAAGQWYFDVAAGKDELLARRIGRNEINTIGVVAALTDAQHEYFSQKHGGVPQYAQKFMSDPGQKNGLYWESPEGAPRSPLGPLVAYATAQGFKVPPNQHQPFNGYYFLMLDKQGPDAEGGAKKYIVDGKMTRGFGIVAYPAEYGNSGIMTFVVNQNGVAFQKDLGKATDEVASAMTEFNPDRTWTPVEH